MAQSNDPRNIFVDNRQGYEQSEQGENKSTDSTTATRDNGASATGNGGATDGQTAGTDYDSRVAEMKRLAAKYQREGEGQLVRDIINTVIEQKAAGRLSNEQLVQFANRVSPLLNAEQKQRLGELLQQLLKL